MYDGGARLQRLGAGVPGEGLKGGVCAGVPGEGADDGGVRVVVGVVEAGPVRHALLVRSEPVVLRAVTTSGSGLVVED